jgi:MFS family permease
MAHFGDLLGRKKMFTLSILLMSVPTLLMGLLPTYASVGLLAPMALLVLRILQGAAVGGEVPGAWVFVSEHVPQRHVGYACGTLTAGLTAGILLGSLVATGINAVFDPQELVDHGWRVPFVLGGVFGVGSMYLRRWLHETPVFAELQQRKALAAELPLKTVVRDHRGAVVIDAADVDAVRWHRGGDPADADLPADAVRLRRPHRAGGQQRRNAVPVDRLRGGRHAG